MDINVHVYILCATLGNEQLMSREALHTITIANCLTDFCQWRPEWHFDSAPNREVICTLWQLGLRTQLNRAVAFSEPARAHDSRLRNRRAALWSFGRATHIIQDFYAHTNWVELTFTQNRREVTAPLNGYHCDIAALPDGLISGYFSMRYAAPWQQFSGCPMHDGHFIPPPGFTYCHAQLAKDSPHRGHGRDVIFPGGPCYGHIAARLAVRATLELWKSFCQEITTRYHHPPSVDGQSLVRQLAWGNRA